MSQINPKLVKELREKTGAGMMDCKKALNKANGDIKEAMQELRKSGIAKAEKKSGRAANEGIIISKILKDSGVMVEILCETDFAAKNEVFQKYSNDILNRLTEFKETGYLSEKLQETEKNNIIDMVSQIGENIRLRRAIRWEGKCASYLHMGGKIGVMIKYEGEADQQTLNNICMHIAAFSPKYIKPEDIPEEDIEGEKEVHKAQLQGKPEELMNKIISGKLSKWYKDVCLIKQPWVRDDKMSVEQAIPNIKILDFIRWQAGENL